MDRISFTYTPYEKHEKIRIGFMVQAASFWPSVESFYEACMEDERMDVVLFLIEELSVEKVQMEGTREFFEQKGISVELYTENAFWQYRPHAAVYQPPYDVSYRNPSALSVRAKQMGARIIYIPYGIEIADTLDARAAHFDTFVVRNSWRIYTFSEMMQEEYKKYCRNRHAVRVCGLPKFDAYYNKKIPIDPQIAELAEGRKIILWKMHFPKLIYEGGRRLQVTPYLDEYEGFERELQGYEDLFFVVMPHPMFFSGTIDQNLGKQAQNLISKLEFHRNVYVDRSSDYRCSLYNADAVIIDRSALMVEAAICEVPVLYLTNPDYTEPLTPPVKMLADAYDQGTGLKHIRHFLNTFRQHTSFASGQRKKVMDEALPFRDGRCGHGIKEDIIAGICAEKPGKIRLVLFGTGQVCRHYVKQLNLLQSRLFKIIAYSDNDSTGWGTDIGGVSVVEPEQLREIEYDILVIMTEQAHMEIMRQLVYELYLDHESIMRLDYFCEYIRGREDIGSGKRNTNYI